MPKLIVLASCLFALAAIGTTVAAFSGQTSNSGNSFSANSTFPGQLRMASGTYTGNGNDNRSISGVGFQPDVVILKYDSGEAAMLRTSTMTGDASKRLAGGNALDSNRIQAIESDGFQVGNHGSVNGSGRVYHWIAFKEGAGVLKVGSYTGNGSSQSVTGVGFSPEYLVTASAGGERAVQWYGGAANTYRFESDAGVSNGVTATGSDGFSVGNANDANANGRTYHYVAFNETAGNVKVGTYTGNGSSQSVSGVGFEPEYAIVRGQANVAGQHRSQSVPGSESMHFTGTGNITTGITALESDGFQVGNNAVVNTNGTTYQYVAFKHGVGCARPVQGQIIVASKDSWVDQANASQNNGSATSLRVTSQSGANQRAFIEFDLPALPQGCVVTNADFYLNNTTPTAGRTLELHRVASSWGEGTITWANQPATTGTAVTAAMGVAGWTGWSATALTTLLYSSGNNGFRVADQSEGAASAATQVFAARETGSLPPILVLSRGS